MFEFNQFFVCMWNKLNFVQDSYMAYCYKFCIINLCNIFSILYLDKVLSENLIVYFVPIQCHFPLTLGRRPEAFEDSFITDYNTYHNLISATTCQQVLSTPLGNIRHSDNSELIFFLR